MFAPPLQIVDSFLLSYNVGDAFLVLFVLGILGTLPLRSRKVLTLHLILFGLLFMLTPSSMFTVTADGNHFLSSTFQYKFLGLILIAIGPIVFTTGGRRAASS